MSLSVSRPNDFIVQEARRLLNAVGATDPQQISVARMASHLGIEVHLESLQGLAGVLLRVGGEASIVVARSRSRERERFTIAHELGHARLHLGEEEARLSCATSDLSMFRAKMKPKEREANQFATALLMPEEMFRPRLPYPPALDGIRTLAEEFRTSLQATAIRFCELTDERCAVVIVRDGSVSAVARSPSFGYSVTHSTRIAPQTYAADAIAGRQVPTRMQDVRLDAWVDEDVPARAMVQEQAVAMPRYGACLSLLWIADDLEDDEEDGL